MRIIFSLVLTLLLSHALGQEASPYAGEQNRSIKSLSDSEIAALENGAGMGFARLAELNHYPGPRHVLDLESELDLSDDQRAESQALFDEMHDTAVALGEALIQAEQNLDVRFADRSIDEAGLEQALQEIAVLRARLRYVHLEAHLRQRALLSAEQIDRYDELRGYGEGSHRHGIHGEQH